MDGRQSRAHQSDQHGRHCAWVEPRLMIGIGRRGRDIWADCGGDCGRYRIAGARVEVQPSFNVSHHFSHHDTPPGPPAKNASCPPSPPSRTAQPRSSTTNPLTLEPVLPFQTSARFQRPYCAGSLSGELDISSSSMWATGLWNLRKFIENTVEWNAEGGVLLHFLNSQCT